MRVMWTALLIGTLTGSGAMADITAEQVAGKTLRLKGSVLVIAADGSLSGTTEKGEKAAGTWWVKSGQWCRTLTAPERLAGSDCKAATIKGNKLVLTQEDGSTVAFNIK